jgi:hypothetical protein
MHSRSDKRVELGIYATSILLVGALTFFENYCTPRAAYMQQQRIERQELERSLTIELNSKRLWYEHDVKYRK